MKKFLHTDFILKIFEYKELSTVNKQYLKISYKKYNIESQHYIKLINII